MALREPDPGVPGVGSSADRDSDRDSDALYGELDRNHFRVRCWSAWIHGYRTFYGTTVSELDCVLMKNECLCLLWTGHNLRQSGSSGLKKRMLVLEQDGILA